MQKELLLRQPQQLYAERKWRSRHVTTQLNERHWAGNPGSSGVELYYMENNASLCFWGPRCTDKTGPCDVIGHFWRSTCIRNMQMETSLD